MSFSIDWLRPFWFGQKTYSDLSVHAHYFSIYFANQPNIEAQIWLDLFSPGATYSNGAVTALGAAAAGFYFYSYVDPIQGSVPVSLSPGPWTSRVRAERVYLLTAWLHVRLASAKADGMIHYWSDGSGSRQASLAPYSEANWCVFDQSTGEVLATETIWTETGAEPSTAGPTPALLSRYSTFRDGKRRNIGSLAMDRIPDTDFRVDPEQRVVELPARSGAGLLAPDPLITGW
jgi:hypothetical protein